MTDPPASVRMLRRTVEEAGLAITFLTVVPLRVRYRGPEQMRRATAWFPLVGAGVGALAGGALIAAEEAFGAAPAAVVAIIVLVALTGGLHQDGLADTADGLGVRADRERRLAVMRDPAVGAFGVLAVVAWALLVVTTLGSLPRDQAVGALIAAGALGRWSALVHALLPAARQDGLGAAFVTSRVPLAIATVTAIAVSVVAAGLTATIAAAPASMAACGAVSGLAWLALRGRTGDTLGAATATTEVAVCLAVLGVWRG